MGPMNLSKDGSIFNYKLLKSLMMEHRGALIRDSWKKAGKCDVLLFRHDYDCGYSYNGKAYAHILDSLGHHFKCKKYAIETIATPYSRLFGDFAHGNPRTINQFNMMISLLEKAISRIRGKEFAADWADRQISGLWLKIFDRTDPKIILGIQPDGPLCRAAKQRHIKVFDVQHGVIADEHPWYGQKFRNDSSADGLPDGFLCWDGQSEDVIRRWASEKGLEVLQVGNPWFIRFLVNDPGDELVQDALKSYRIDKNTKPSILVTLQWGFQEDRSRPASAYRPFPEALERAIIETEDVFDWNLRLHPVQLRGEEFVKVRTYLSETFSPEKAAHWIDMSEVPLPIVLLHTDVHVTYDSTVIVEAGWMGILSGMLNKDLNEGPLEGYYEHERSIGLAESIPNDSEGIRQWIDEQLAKGRSVTALQPNTDKIHAFIERNMSKS